MSETLTRIDEYIEKTKRKNLVESVWHCDKGRCIIAKKYFSPGCVILVEPCLHFVEIPHSENNLFNTLQHLCKTHHFPLEPFWYWCALNSVIVNEDLDTNEELSRNEYCLKTLKRSVLQRILLLYRPSHITVGEEVPLLMEAFNLRCYRVRCETLEYVLQAWIFNCFDASETGFALYFLPSFFSHSCIPNAIWNLRFICPEPEPHFVLIARMKIRAGEEITLSYLSEHGLLEPTFMRQHELRSTKLFGCSCPRCTASVDLCRGFLCPLCETGLFFLHPQSFFTENIILPASHPRLSQKTGLESQANNVNKTLLAYLSQPLNDSLAFIHWIHSLTPFVCMCCPYVLDQESYQYILRKEVEAFQSCVDLKLDWLKDSQMHTSNSSLSRSLMELKYPDVSLFENHWVAFSLSTESRHSSLTQLERSLKNFFRIKMMLNIPSGCLVESYNQIFEAYCLHRWADPSSPLVSDCFRKENVLQLKHNKIWLILFMLYIEEHFTLFQWDQASTDEMLNKASLIACNLYESCKELQLNFLTTFPSFCSMIHSISLQYKK